MRLRTIAAWWNKFWFEPVYPTSIGVYRILFGLTVLFYGFILSQDWGLWFSDSGVLSLETAWRTGFKPQVNLFVCLPPGDIWVTRFFFFFMLWAFLLTIGLFTRLSSAMVWLCLSSLYNRNLAIANGATVLMLCFSFFLIFTQAGAAVSADRLWRIARGKEPVLLSKSPPWGQRLIQLQLCFVYFSTAWMKTQSTQWISGVALYYVARDDLWRRFGIPFAEHLWVCKLYTWGTLFLEFLLAMGIWFYEWRYWIISLGFLFHLGMELALNIPWFQYVTASALVTFIEPERLTLLMDKLRAFISRRAGPPHTLFYDGACEACSRSAALARVLDIGGRLSLVNFRTDNRMAIYRNFGPEQTERAEREMLLLLPNGRWLGGFYAFRRISRCLPLLWPISPFLYLPGVSVAGTSFYRWFSKNRYRFLGARCSDGSCRLPENPLK